MLHNPTVIPAGRYPRAFAQWDNDRSDFTGDDRSHERNRDYCLVGPLTSTNRCPDDAAFEALLLDVRRPEALRASRHTENQVGPLQLQFVYEQFLRVRDHRCLLRFSPVCRVADSNVLQVREIHVSFISVESFRRVPSRERTLLVMREEFEKHSSPKAFVGSSNVNSSFERHLLLAGAALISV